MSDELPPRLKLLRWIGHRKWIPFGQDRLLRTIANPDTCPHFRFEVDFFGLRYRGDLAHYIDWLVFCYGGAPTAEISLLEAVAAYLRGQRAERISFFDIGANAGHHTLFMARLADEVFAFEPLPALQALINEKIALNGLRNVRLVPFALGDSDTVLDYYPGLGSNTGTGTFVPTGHEARTDAIKLTVKQGDALFDAENFGRVNIIKADVEGFEPYVFRGLTNRIKRDRPFILTELSGASRSGFGSDTSFRNSFYEGAQFFAVEGRHGHRFKLRPFDYRTTEEALIVPPEARAFIEQHSNF